MKNFQPGNHWACMLIIFFFIILASYPIDTIRRRMMMTSGAAVKYDSSLHAFREIVAKEGTKSLFKGAGANILRAIAGAGVLSGYDYLQVWMFGKKF